MLWLRSAVFTVLLPGTVLVGVPLLLSGGDGEADPAELGIGSLRWVGLPLVVLGAPLTIDADAFKTADGNLEASLRMICEKVHAYGDVPVGKG